MLVYNNVLVQENAVSLYLLKKSLMEHFIFCAVLVRIVFASQKRRIE